MNPKLSDELRRALEAASDGPLTIDDDQRHKVFYLVDEQSYLHLQGLRAEQEQQCHEQLRRLIDEGMQSPGVPADVAFARLRSFADDLTRNAP